jgi:hypothetical protein
MVGKIGLRRQQRGFVIPAYFTAMAAVDTLTLIISVQTGRALPDASVTRPPASVAAFGSVTVLMLAGIRTASGV